jgi:hypothetical protein
MGVPEQRNKLEAGRRHQASFARRSVRPDRAAAGTIGPDLHGAAPGPKTEGPGSRITRADHDPKFREDPKPDPPPAGRNQSRNLSKLGRTTGREG